MARLSTASRCAATAANSAVIPPPHPLAVAPAESLNTGLLFAVTPGIARPEGPAGQLAVSKLGKVLEGREVPGGGGEPGQEAGDNTMDGASGTATGAAGALGRVPVIKAE